MHVLLTMAFDPFKQLCHSSLFSKKRLFNQIQQSWWRRVLPSGQNCSNVLTLLLYNGKAVESGVACRNYAFVAGADMGVEL